MTNTGMPSSDPDPAALLAEARRRQRQVNLYVSAALVVVAFAAFGAGVLAGDTAPDKLWPAFLLMLIPPLIGAVVALVFGRRILRRLPNRAPADPETLRRVKRALRDGHTDDPRIDALARDEATRWLSQGWVRWGAVALLLSQTWLLVRDADTVIRVVAAVGVLCAVVLLWTQGWSRRQARRYLAGRHDG
ncbi:hypothetical protein K7640_03100 [Micromonospora sp. PLK6-60]|uniref:hypothetical protein n=1 Tax=Micromonospora sp. PLK6-60 TaxID=2873383 RepID=UPI001CA632C4|nr:hypothetical protein [Micromonospora sp. PLK6-60]MBY8870830.1 hypothetical protein [Micromonospora sp. PLK6-60]